ncbi:hypothetical protein MMC16_000764 [Acarospora aff. strigata]|nr:hypothetical protein [Acarospora aff. strigata]
MRVTSLTLLYAAIWHTSTVLALVAARPLDLNIRADTTPKYPKGHDAKTCPLESTSRTTSPASAAQPRIIPDASQAESKAGTLPAALMAAGAPKVPTSTTTQRRDLTPDELAQICRQIGRWPFTANNYQNQHGIRDVITETLPPGLYVTSVTANVLIRFVDIAEVDPPRAGVALVWGNQSNQIGTRFQISHPTRLTIRIVFWSSNMAGELSLFRLGPRGWTGPYPEIG